MQVDSVCNAGFPRVLNIEPAILETVLPDYLADRTTRHTYNRYRGRAGR
jgi:NADH dehydrogenase